MEELCSTKLHKLYNFYLIFNHPIITIILVLLVTSIKNNVIVTLNVIILYKMYILILPISCFKIN